LSGTVVLTEKWPVFARHERARSWLQVWTDLGRAPRTIDAYARGLAEYLEMCERDGVDPLAAGRADVARFVRELTERPSRRGGNVVSIDSGSGLANATIQQRIVPVRLFYDFLMEEGLRESNPVGLGRFTPGRWQRGQQRGLVSRLTKLPWIPSETHWMSILDVAKTEPIRNRVMLALAYDAALRREELCSLRTEDLDPAHRTLRIRAETTKNRLERVVPYSASTGVLLSGYFAYRATISRACGPALAENLIRPGQAVSPTSTLSPHTPRDHTAGWLAVLLRLAYLGLTNTFALLRLLPMTDRDKDTEILVLRHQITVLQRQLSDTRVRFSPTDRALLAALLHRLPRQALHRLGLLVRPDTILRVACGSRSSLPPVSSSLTSKGASRRCADDRSRLKPAGQIRRKPDSSGLFSVHSGLGWCGGGAARHELRCQLHMG
jgi:site-specific recombinase XerD